MKLFSREYLPTSEWNGQTLVILHGLFGSSDNWLTQAKIFSTHSYKVYTLDQRNHGQSPHCDVFDYESMVADLVEFIDTNSLSSAIVIGHSMGGKTAMNFALKHPEKLSKLIVVDIAPRAYDLEHYTILEGLNAISVQTITSRNEADQSLAAFVADAEVRQFLLKNLQRKSEGGFSWKLNLPVITEKLKNVGVDVLYESKYTKPTLFIKGTRSKYIVEEDLSRINEIFPGAKIKELETGHWVQAEKPQEFVDLVRTWIEMN